MKNPLKQSVLADFYLAGAEGLEPSARGFGDNYDIAKNPYY